MNPSALAKRHPRPWGPLSMVILGVVFFVVGLVLTAHPHHAQAILRTSEEVVSHLSVGFIAIGILTALAESLSAYLVHRDVHRATEEAHGATLQAIEKVHQATLLEVKRLQEATAEKLLSSFFGDEIFPEIRAQFIQKPFVRTGYRTHIALDPADSGQTLWQRTIVKYTIRNVSLQTQAYDLHVEEEWGNGTEITAVKVRRGNSVDDLAPLAVRTPHALCLKRELAFAPGEAVDIEIGTRREQQWTGSHPTHFSHSTVVHEIEVSHASDLEVRLQLFHPAADDLLPEVDAAHSKKWTFNRVFLNYQGFRVEWQRATQKVQVPGGKIVSDGAHEPVPSPVQ